MTVASAKVYVVTSLQDGPEGQLGTNTLRGALLDARDKSKDKRDVIKFRIPGKSRTINLVGQPLVFNNITIGRKKSIIIDGFSQSKGSEPPIILNAGGLNSSIILSEGSKHKIRGLQFINFSGSAIVIEQGSRKNVILKNWIGFEKAGSGFDSNNRQYSNATGILLQSKQNKIKRNVISGSHNGIHIGYNEADPSTFNRPECRANLVRSNRIGTTPDGRSVLSNNSDGIYMGPRASFNNIKANLISGNASAGVELLHRTTKGNRISRNLIGTDVSGEFRLGNGDNGVHMANYATGNIVDSNVVAGNRLVGILMEAVAPKFGESRITINNTVTNNLVGCNTSGTKELRGQNIGIYLHGVDSRGNTVRGNVAGGNLWWGIYSEDSFNNTIDRNFSGVNKVGGRIPNGRGGIIVDGGGGCRVTNNVVRFNGYDSNPFNPSGIWFLNTSGNSSFGNIVNSNRNNKSQ